MSALLFWLLPRELARKLADLVWIIAGGGGAATALALSTYSDDRSALQAEAQILNQRVQLLRERATSFLTENCAFDPYADQFTRDRALICKHAAALSRRAELAILSDPFPELLPSINLPPEGFLLSCPETGTTLGECRLSEGLSWGKSSASTNSADAVERLLNSGEVVGARGRLDGWPQYDAMARNSEALGSQLDYVVAGASLISERWTELEQQRYKIPLRFFSLCILAIVFPFRIAKSLSDFRV